MTEPAPAAEPATELKLFEVIQYQTYAVTFTVRAATAAEAIVSVINDDDGIVESTNLPEYVEVNTDLGVPADDWPDTAEELEKYNVDCETHIPSIAEVNELRTVNGCIERTALAE